MSPGSRRKVLVNGGSLSKASESPPPYPAALRILSGWVLSGLGFSQLYQVEETSSSQEARPEPEPNKR